jgi:hypothetical protein
MYLFGYHPTEGQLEARDACDGVAAASERGITRSARALIQAFRMGKPLHTLPVYRSDIEQ